MRSSRHSAIPTARHVRLRLPPRDVIPTPRVRLRSPSPRHAFGRGPRSPSPRLQAADSPAPRTPPRRTWIRTLLIHLLEIVRNMFRAVVPAVLDSLRRLTPVALAKTKTER